MCVCITWVIKKKKKSEFLSLSKMSPLTVYGRAAATLLSCPTILKL